MGATWEKTNVKDLLEDVARRLADTADKKDVTQLLDEIEGKINESPYIVTRKSRWRLLLDAYTQHREAHHRRLGEAGIDSKAGWAYIKALDSRIQAKLAQLSPPPGNAGSSGPTSPQRRNP